MGESELDYRRYFSASSSLSPHPDDGHSRRSSCAIKHSLRRLLALASNRCSEFHVISLLFFYFSSHPSTAINALMLVLFADIPATVVASLKERRRCCFVLTAVTCRLEEANDFQRRHFHYDRFIINFSLLKKLFFYYLHKFRRDSHSRRVAARTDVGKKGKSCSLPREKAEFLNGNVN